MLAILAGFGRKLGAVTKMRRYYYGYYIAIGCLIVTILTHLLRASVFWAPVETVPPLFSDPIFYLLLHHLPMAIGLTLSLGVTWYYWSWLLKEK
jgi:predicted membrane channel-forming protein YqfA (hemolysin III family)